MKKLISCVVLFAVILSGTAAAATSSKKIDVTYGISVTVNGETLIPRDINGKVVDPFVYDGTTYVPIRAISDALGATVGYDGATNSATINSNADNSAALNALDKTVVAKELGDFALLMKSTIGDMIILAAAATESAVEQGELYKETFDYTLGLLEDIYGEYIKGDRQLSGIMEKILDYYQLFDEAVDDYVNYSKTKDDIYIENLSEAYLQSVYSYAAIYSELGALVGEAYENAYSSQGLTPTFTVPVD